jgi:hypothetical protein
VLNIKIYINHKKSCNFFSVFFLSSGKDEAIDDHGRPVTLEKVGSRQIGFSDCRFCSFFASATIPKKKSAVGI